MSLLQLYGGFSEQPDWSRRVCCTDSFGLSARLTYNLET